ncbi:hypothetical protein [Streptacidiphilus fuscans]|uniref:Uncharacterized protein n=1 Tax=Streptacidiphilus fuscans TaxID=2789292 RepID=A0A931FDE0_9ACTN|nr:hypothetical protein [Streptacidiphilus fuscans]MBF9069468.1 hypothetical protein [Streptacidiphilus fuscans]
MALTALSALAFAGAPAAHAVPHHVVPNGATTVVCHGGDIAPGYYYELVVDGTCTIPSGKVTVETQLYVTPHSVLDAITGATVHVKGNVQVDRGAALGLGCSPHANCSTTTDDVVGGNINSDHALAVILHSDTVKGDITTLNDGAGVNCAPQPSLAVFATLANNGVPTPAYDDFEDNNVGGYITSSHLRSCYMATSRNHVGTNILVADDKVADPDGNAVGSNTVNGDLGCYHNTPAPHFGTSTGPNDVRGLKLGQGSAL